MNQYKVLEQYPKGEEQPCATFKNLDDAKFFMQHKVDYFRQMNVNVKFLLYRGFELLEESATTQQGGSSGSASTDSQGQNKTSSVNFKPTPFNMAPRPTGMPPKWVTDNDEEDKDKS